MQNIFLLWVLMVPMLFLLLLFFRVALNNGSVSTRRNSNGLALSCCILHTSLMLPLGCFLMGNLNYLPRGHKDSHESIALPGLLIHHQY